MKKNKAGWLRRMKSRYRLVIMDEATFEEKASFRLSKLNIFVLLSTACVFLIAIIFSLVAFTPLKVYLVGYDEISMNSELIALKLKVDSLQYDIELKDFYLENIRKITSGNIDMTRPKMIKPDHEVSPILMEKISDQKKIMNNSDGNNQFLVQRSVRNEILPALQRLYFYKPVDGYLTQEFNSGENHFGVDIVAPENSIVKATLDGTVVFADWTLDAGYVIGIQHRNNLTSIYKHNAVLLKKIGNFVRAGDVIAYVGNSGDYTSGTHLHFELWNNGVPLDPAEFIVFK